MPPAPTCICGDCAICRKRKAQTEWKTRARSGVTLTAEEKTAAARKSVRIRWGNRTRAVSRTAAEKRDYDRKRAADIRAAERGEHSDQEPSDQELDRRAAEMLFRESM